MPLVTGLLDRTRSMVRVSTAKGPATLHVTSADQVGAALVWHTGSRQHTEQLRARADKAGLILGDGQLRRPGWRAVSTPTEEDLYRHLGLPLIPPELREGGDEIALCRERGSLPCLVSASAHPWRSPHAHDVERRARHPRDDGYGAKGLGYEYVAITDHSERAWSSRKLAAADVPRQRQEIEELRSENQRDRGAARCRGRHHERRHARLRRRGCWPGSTSCSPRSTITAGRRGEELTARYLSAIAAPARQRHHPPGQPLARAVGRL